MLFAEGRSVICLKERWTHSIRSDASVHLDGVPLALMHVIQEQLQVAALAVVVEKTNNLLLNIDPMNYQELWIRHEQTG